MLMRDTFADTQQKGESVLLHIYEKKKPAGYSVLSSSFSKYANSVAWPLSSRRAVYDPA
ncbi:MAG: hypothetical protein ACSHXH_01870 [Marivita sp.]|uniref:hypothetical protein n=1 Tax=Marivita sp. TaxID=2003365 RepID=UPI003EF41E75